MTTQCRTPKVGELIINHRDEPYMRICLDVTDLEVSILILDEVEFGVVDVPAAKHVIEASIEMEEWLP